jgi:hypothetical protein
MRVPLFHDHPTFARPRRGPLLGSAVLVIVAPTECDARGVFALWRALHSFGVRMGVTMECHGEARGEDDTPINPNCLLIEVTPDSWDALVFAGGRGVGRVAEDPLARAVAQRFSSAHKIVAALGDGARALAAARLDGIVAADALTLTAQLVARLFPSPPSPQRRAVSFPPTLAPHAS